MGMGPYRMGFVNNLAMPCYAKFLFWIVSYCFQELELLLGMSVVLLIDGLYSITYFLSFISYSLFHGPVYHTYIFVRATHEPWYRDDQLRSLNCSQFFFYLYCKFIIQTNICMYQGSFFINLLEST